MLVYILVLFQLDKTVYIEWKSNFLKVSGISQLAITEVHFLVKLEFKSVPR